jgi:hypothetical protein
MSTYYTEEPEVETWESDGEYYPEEPEFIGRIFRGRTPAPAAPTRPYTPPPTTPSNFVTKPELERALGGVRSDMQKNAAAIRSVGQQVDALSSRTRRELAAFRNESRNTTQMLALMPLLAAPRPVTVSADVNDVDNNRAIPAGTRLATVEDGLTSVLPLLAIGGGFGGAGGGQQGGMDPMMMLVLALSLGRR